MAVERSVRVGSTATVWGGYLGGTRVPVVQPVVTRGAGASGDLPRNGVAADKIPPPFLIFYKWIITLLCLIEHADSSSEIMRPLRCSPSWKPLRVNGGERLACQVERKKRGKKRKKGGKITVKM